MDDLESDLRTLVRGGRQEPPLPASVRTALGQLAVQVPNRARGRRRRRVGVVGLVALAGVVGGTAAAGVYTTHTGRSSIEYGVNTGEVLDTRAPDFEATVRSTVPRLPLPAGQSWEPYVDSAVKTWRTSQGTVGGISTKSVTQAWALHAWCAWAADWYASPGSGGPAAKQLVEAPSWRGLVIYRHDGVGNSVNQLADAVKTTDLALANKALLGWIAVPGSQVPTRLLGCAGFDK